MKAEIAAANLYRRTLRMILRRDLAGVGVVRRVNPVVQAVAQIGDSIFGIDLRKAGVENLARIRLTVAVRVFHPQNIGRACDQQAAFPRHDPADLQNLIGEDDRAFVFAVAVVVFEQPDARTRRFARRRIVGVIEHLGHVDAPVFVPDHLDRAVDLRLGQEEFDFEVFADFDGRK
ncbi:MAG: hypothetical protein JMDDDDMK_03280 [Acidobacteria bacterium]|nr:hypothetical protein [Acidobacteriota bacterium]